MKSLPPRVCSPWRPVLRSGGWLLERTMQTPNGPIRETYARKPGARSVVYSSESRACAEAKALNQGLRHWLAKMAPEQLAASDEWPEQLRFHMDQSSNRKDITG